MGGHLGHGARCGGGLAAGHVGQHTQGRRLLRPELGLERARIWQVDLSQQQILCLSTGLAGPHFGLPGLWHLDVALSLLLGPAASGGDHPTRCRGWTQRNWDHVQSHHGQTQPSQRVEHHFQVFLFRTCTCTATSANQCMWARKWPKSSWPRVSIQTSRPWKTSSYRLSQYQYRDIEINIRDNLGRPFHFKAGWWQRPCTFASH